jgi:hypothetical protein
MPIPGALVGCGQLSRINGRVVLARPVSPGSHRLIGELIGWLYPLI